MCSQWDRPDGFPAFFAHVGPKPMDQPRGLDRIDNGCNYEPGNVRWATREEQNRNKRSNVWIDDPTDGEHMIAADFADKHGLHRNTVLSRIRWGQDPLTGRRS